MCLASLAALYVAGCGAHDVIVPGKPTVVAQRAEPSPAWRPLFDGQSLEGWTITQFGPQGEVTAADGQIVLGYGDGLTGVAWTRDFPTTDYELRLEAMRIDGGDIFCGLTFPVADSWCSLIVGGWGGSVVGLSCVDGDDAAHNATKRLMAFQRGQWYAVRLRVDGERIQAWIDETPLVDQPLAGHKFTLRSDIELSKPLGVASWCTTAAVRKIEWRPLAGALPMLSE